MDRYKRLGQFLVLVVFFSFVSSLALAGVSIDPGIVEMSGKPGVEINGVLIFKNGQKGTVAVGISMANWLKQEIRPEEWLKIEPGYFSVDAQKSKEVKYTVNIPQEVKGELMAMVFFTITNKEKGGIGMQIGIPFYIAVEGAVDLAPVIDNCYLKVEDGNLNGYVFITNQSNVHIRPRIKAILENKEEKFYRTAHVYYGAPIRANERKDFSFSVKDIQNIPKQCKVTVIMNYGIAGQHDSEIKKEFELNVFSKDSSKEDDTGSVEKEEKQENVGGLDI